MHFFEYEISSTNDSWHKSTSSYGEKTQHLLVSLYGDCKYMPSTIYRLHLTMQTTNLKCLNLLKNLIIMKHIDYANTR